MLSTQQLNWYRAFRKAGYGAKQSLESARIVRRFGALERMGAVWIETPDDEDFDPSDFEHPEDFTGPAYGVVGKFRTDFAGRESWNLSEPANLDTRVGDSIWGCTGYDDVKDPIQNPYVVDIMAETIRQFRAAWHEHLFDRHLITCPHCMGAGRVMG